MKSPAVYKRGDKGFTLIELLLVIGLTFVLAGAIFPSFASFYVGSQLEAATQQVVAYLRLARSESMARRENKSYGVYINNDSVPHSITLYRGTSYASRLPSFDQTLEFDESVLLSSTIPGDDVRFGLATGTTTAGSITIRHDVNGLNVITLTSVGTADAD